MNVPKRANDAMHLSMLEGVEENLAEYGDVLLQDNFTVWDPKQIIKKGRDRHLFLFDVCLIFSKEVKDSNGKSKYIFKFKLMVCAATWTLAPLDNIWHEWLAGPADLHCFPFNPLSAQITPECVLRLSLKMCII